MKTKQENFEALFELSKAKLFNVAYSVVRNREAAEDVLQDAYIKAWKKFDEYDSDKKFTNWMTTIVRNAGIDYNRLKAKHASTYSLNSISSQLTGDKSQIMSLDVEDKSQDVVKQVERIELINEIYQSIADLPDDLKVVMLPFFDNQSYEEIAVSEKLPLTTVRARVHRAKQILRKSINPELLANF